MMHAATAVVIELSSHGLLVVRVFDDAQRTTLYWWRDEVLELMHGAELEEVRIAPVNEMSWCAIGTKKS